MQMSAFIFYGKDSMLTLPNGELPSESDIKNSIDSNLIGETYVDKVTGISASKFLGDENKIPDNFSLMQVREYFFTNTPEKAAKVARAKGLQGWNSSVVFCQKCGAQLEHDSLLTAKNCLSCKAQYFPRIEPCIITLISRGDEVLLARHKLRIQDIYTCIAGFIEIGETTENAVIREVREEVGIEIKDIRYCASQSWPFPDQLMLGFRAEYAGGEIHIQRDELLEARWFKRDNLPNIPKHGSIAYRLITGEFD